MATKKAADEAEATACVAYTGGWSGDLVVYGVPDVDQHQIDGALAARLVESGAYRALRSDCAHHSAVEQPDSEVPA